MIELLEHADLSALNTFHLPGSARWLATVSSADDIAELFLNPALSALPRIVLGGGSNIILRGGEIDAVLVRFSRGGWREVERDGGTVRIEADAGMRWHDLVAQTVAAGLGGIENLALIPGTVGAAPVQNIGAYGVELASVLHGVEAVDMQTGAVSAYSRADCAFGYRDSVFKHAQRNAAITRVWLDLAADAPLQADYRDLRDELQARGSPPLTRELIFDMVCAIRRRKLPDPDVLGNAGSFFKNPVVSAAHFRALQDAHPDIVGYAQPDGSVKVAAGWLIDRAGWKGRSENGVAVHERQALVLVNRGGASGAAVLALAARIAADIEARFGIALAMEPIVL